MPINPKEAPEGFYAGPPSSDDSIPTCTSCWFYVNKELCPYGVSCISYDRKDKTNVIFLKLDSD